MNIVKRILLFILLFIVVISCNEKLFPGVDVPKDDVSSEYDKVTMVIPPVIFEEDVPETKIDIDYNTMKYLWALTDTVGIFPDQGSQIYFSMSKGVGTSIATFDGGGWALKKSSEYFSYFPFVASYYIDKESIPVSYLGQEQDGNGNLNIGTLNNYSYMASKGTADPNTGALMFTYERLQMPFLFVLPVEPGTYTSLDVCAGEKVIAVSGKMNAISLDKMIHEAVYDDHLSVSLKNISFTEPSTLIVSATIPPFNIYGKQLTINLTKSDGTNITSSVFGKDYALGKGYKIAPNFTLSPTFAELPGEGGSFDFRITSASSSQYSVTTDVDWLRIDNSSTSGNAVVTVTASASDGSERIGHVIVSEDVTYKETTITLHNKIQVTQNLVGMFIGLGGWDGGDEDYGGVAR